MYIVTPFHHVNAILKFELSEYKEVDCPRTNKTVVQTDTQCPLLSPSTSGYRHRAQILAWVIEKRVCSHRCPASTVLGHHAREPRVNSAYYCSLEHSNCSTPCLLAFNLSLQTIPRSFVVAYRTQFFTCLEHGEVKFHYIKLLSLKGIRLQRAKL